MLELDLVSLCCDLHVGSISGVYNAQKYNAKVKREMWR